MALKGAAPAAGANLIQADLHLHTCYSHGHNTPFEMHKAALDKGLTLIGFSEHSPRPAGFNYTHEYRAHLTRHWPSYLAQVKKLREEVSICRVLLGIEMDWLDGQREFIGRACEASDFDYIIGSVHFLGAWGFDDGRESWENASAEVCEQRYITYFRAWKEMLRSGLFQIAAHPDLIKIYSACHFHKWLQKEESLDLVRSCLVVLRDAGMAMEISSAGLRKPCAEIYPAPPIMRLAAELHLPVSMASDAHCVKDVGADFDMLAAYARSFGFSRQTVFIRRQPERLPF